MVIPVGMRVVNKNVVYSDTVLSLKDIGGNIVVTRVNGVRNSEFDDCINLIFNENRDVVFNTIQYSRKDKRLYLYTDKPVSINAWNDRGKSEFIYKGYDKGILEKIRSDLFLEDSLEPSVVSLYDVWNLYRKKNNFFQRQLKEIESDIDRIVKENFDDEFLMMNHSFMEDSIVINTCTSSCYFDGNGKFVFKRGDNGDLYISESEKKGFCSIDESNLLMCIGDEVARIFDLYDNDDVFKDRYKRDVRNYSNVFRVDMSGCIRVYIYGIINMNLCPWKDEAEIECNSNDILSCIKDNEYELFKKIFVNIEDCPDSIKDELYCYRADYLKKLEDERNMEAKREKSLRYKFKSIMKKYLS